MDYSLFMKWGGMARFNINLKQNLWPPVIEMKRTDMHGPLWLSFIWKST